MEGFDPDIEIAHVVECAFVAIADPELTELRRVSPSLAIVDLESDPHELENLAVLLDSALAALSNGNCTLSFDGAAAVLSAAD